ncbi:hypothetical protein SRHO_G00323270 [Serrasalmus rhombeus]
MWESIPTGDWRRELQGDWSIWTLHPHQQDHQPFGFVQSADATQSCEGNRQERCTSFEGGGRGSMDCIDLRPEFFRREEN